MPSFGKKSKEKLAQLHPDLQKVLNEAIKHYDFTILEGHRDQATQDKYYAEGKSKVKYPQSKHNTIPSEAVDLAPYYNTAPHIRWNNTNDFSYLAGFIRGIALSMGIKIRWGGDFNRNNEIGDDNLVDMPHHELED